MSAQALIEQEGSKIITLPTFAGGETAHSRQIALAVEEDRLDDARKMLDALKREQQRKLESLPLHRRTRFFVKCAKETGVRTAALVYLATIMSANLPAHRRHWHQKAEWFGKQIGLSRSGLLRVKESKLLAKWLKVEPTPRGLLMMPTRTSFAELKKSRESSHNTLGFFFPSLARVLGVNASVVYRLMRARDEQDGKQRVLGPEGVARRLPWLSVGSARIELTRLYQRGILQRKPSSIGRSCLYYWRKRTAEEAQERIKQAKVRAQKSK